MHSLKNTIVSGLIVLGLSLGLMISAVAADFRTAKELAERGNSDAQTNIGNMYFNGLGVSKNYPIARSWFRKAAAQNNAYAQYNLGYM